MIHFSKHKVLVLSFLSSVFILSQSHQALASDEPGIEPTMFPQTQTMLKCLVPSDPVKWTMDIDLYNDTSKDFVTFTLMKDGQKVENEGMFYNQMDKGELLTSLEAGRLDALLLTEQMKQEDGVVKNVGMLTLSQQANGAFSGLMIAQSNLYRLLCVSLLPKKTPAPKKPEAPKRTPLLNPIYIIQSLKHQISVLLNF